MTFLVLLVPVIGLSVLSGPSAVSIYLSFLSVMDLCVCAVAVGTRQGLAAAATVAGSPCVAGAAVAAAGGVAVAATTIQAGRCVWHTLASDRAFVSLNTIHARRGLHAFTTRPSPAATPTNATTRKRARSDSCGSRTSKRLSNGASAEEESECADYPSSRLQNLDDLQPFMMLRVARKCAPSWDGGDVVVTNKGLRTDRHTRRRYITVKKPGDGREYHVIDDPDQIPVSAEHGVVVPQQPVSSSSRAAGTSAAAAARGSSSSTAASVSAHKRKHKDAEGWEHAGGENEDFGSDMSSTDSDSDGDSNILTTDDSDDESTTSVRAD